MCLFLLVIEGNGGRFSGGFDINVFQKVHGAGMRLLFSLVVEYSVIYIRFCYFVFTTVPCGLAGDVSLMPDVSVELVVNLIEGLYLTFGVSYFVI